jgi:hypothetical protein
MFQLPLNIIFFSPVNVESCFVRSQVPGSYACWLTTNLCAAVVLLMFGRADSVGSVGMFDFF